MESDKTGFLGSLRGIVETLEQKSGLNSLLYLDAIIALPGLILYGLTSKAIFLSFVWILVVFTLVVYAASFLIDRNFLRSETHVQEMRQLDILGEKDKELVGRKVLDIQPTTDPTPKQIGGKNK